MRNTSEELYFATTSSLFYFGERGVATLENGRPHFGTATRTSVGALRGRTRTHPGTCKTYYGTEPMLSMRFRFIDKENKFTIAPTVLRHLKNPERQPTLTKEYRIARPTFLFAGAVRRQCTPIQATKPFYCQGVYIYICTLADTGCRQENRSIYPAQLSMFMNTPFLSASTARQNTLQCHGESSVQPLIAPRLLRETVQIV